MANGHGGSRAGAGRKQSPKVVLAKVNYAGELTPEIEIAIWNDLLNDESAFIRFSAIKFLTEQSKGKASQRRNQRTDGNRVILVGKLGNADAQTTDEVK